MSDESLAAMLDFEPVDDPAEPIAAAYGLGVGVLHLPKLDDLEHYGHTGSGFGYVALMLYLPRHQASVVVLGNDGVTMNPVSEPFLRAVGKAGPAHCLTRMAFGWAGALRPSRARGSSRRPVCGNVS